MGCSFSWWMTGRAAWWSFVGAASLIAQTMMKCSSLVSEEMIFCERATMCAVNDGHVVMFVGGLVVGHRCYNGGTADGSWWSQRWGQLSSIKVAAMVTVTVDPVRKWCDELFSVSGGEGRRWKVVIGQCKDGGWWVSPWLMAAHGSSWLYVFH